MGTVARCPKCNFTSDGGFGEFPKCGVIVSKFTLKTERRSSCSAGPSGSIFTRSRSAGPITKKWSGLVKEATTDADNFGTVFPKDLDIHTKTILLGAVFLIEFVHFEK